MELRGVELTWWKSWLCFWHCETASANTALNRSPVSQNSKCRTYCGLMRNFNSLIIKMHIQKLEFCFSQLWFTDMADWSKTFSQKKTLNYFQIEMYMYTIFRQIHLIRSCRQYSSNLPQLMHHGISMNSHSCEIFWLPAFSVARSMKENALYSDQTIGYWKGRKLLYLSLLLVQ